MTVACSRGSLRRRRTAVASKSGMVMPEAAAMSIQPWSISVRVAPGEVWLTRMPAAPYSKAAYSVRAAMARLLAP